MTAFTEEILIRAPVDRVWTALADLGSIYQWNPGVKASRLTTSGDLEVGSGRFCDLGGNDYLDEKVVEWDPPRALTMRIIGTNLPFESAEVRFTLSGSGEETTVTVLPTYKLKFGPIGKALDTLVVRSQYKMGMRALLQGLKEFVEKSAGGEGELK